MLQQLVDFLDELNQACNWSDTTLAVASYSNGCEYAVFGVFTRDFQRFVTAKYLQRRQLKCQGDAKMAQMLTYNLKQLDRSLTTEIKQMREATCLAVYEEIKETIEFNSLKQAGGKWRQKLYEMTSNVAGMQCKVVQFTIELV